MRGVRTVLAGLALLVSIVAVALPQAGAHAASPVIATSGHDCGAPTASAGDPCGRADHLDHSGLCVLGASCLGVLAGLAGFTQPVPISATRDRIVPAAARLPEGRVPDPEPRPPRLFL